MVERDGRFIVPSWSGYEEIGIPAIRIPFSPDYIEIEDREVRGIEVEPIEAMAYIEREGDRSYIRFSTGGHRFRIPERVAEFIEREIGREFPVRIFRGIRRERGGNIIEEYYYPIPV
jgi:hypothetical protein